MLFNSLIFAVFAPAFFVVYNLVKKNQRLKWIVITIFSFIFYGWWDWRFLFLILFSGLLDYISALNMHKSKRFFLWLSLIGNLGCLSIFKYSTFFANNIDWLMRSIGIESSLSANINTFSIVLPVGISFYTFQSMSYTIDVYKGKMKPVKNLFLFFSYLSMFPQLVAGPIVRARDLFPQLLKNRKVPTVENWNGLKLIVFGFFKKTVIADNLAPFVNEAFRLNNEIDSTIYWFFVISCFAFQIYFDFSGYSDIARGLAKWMGLHFRLNFNHPYLSFSLKEFWQKWHISLSTWFRDYVYIPFGGSKKGFYLGLFFMFLTMVISGFWHGAAWTFIVWGALHGVFLGIERITKYTQYLEKYKIGKPILLLIILLQVWFAWVFFRAENIEQASSICRHMLSFNFDLSFINYSTRMANAFFFFLLGVVFEYCFLIGTRRFLFKRTNFVLMLDVLIISVITVACIFFRGPQSDFIYFQF